MRIAMLAAAAVVAVPVFGVVVFGGDDTSVALASPLCGSPGPASGFPAGATAPATPSAGTSSVPGSPTSPLTASATASAGVAAGVTVQLPTLDAEQLSNAAAILTVRATMKLPALAGVVAIDAALTESGLHNLDHGDLDSLGLFQERPSQGWGTPEQVEDPQYAAQQFFTHLTQIADWQTMPVDVAAQAVEASGHPERYGPNVGPAEAIVGAVDGTVCGTGPSGTDGGVRLPGTTAGEKAVNAALSQLGIPYSWGGGNGQGPTIGSGAGAATVGFDCSGLVLFAYAQATGLSLPHSSESQATYGQHVPLDQLQPGDLLFFHTDGGIASHVGIYDGSGGMIDAPRTGLTVSDEPNVLTNSYWSAALDFATRPTA
jgi:cell wall-associated NlpC family hydrolase